MTIFDAAYNTIFVNARLQEPTAEEKGMVLLVGEWQEVSISTDLMPGTRDAVYVGGRWFMKDMSGELKRLVERGIAPAPQYPDKEEFSNPWLKPGDTIGTWEF